MKSIAGIIAAAVVGVLERLLGSGRRERWDDAKRRQDEELASRRRKREAN